MRHKMNKTAKYLIICLLISSIFACFTACGSSEAAGGAAAETEVQADETVERYEVPKFRGAKFHEDEASGNDEVMVDTSRSDKGFFGIHCVSDKKIKVQVFKDDEVYTYDLVTGKDQIYLPYVSRFCEDKTLRSALRVPHLRCRPFCRFPPRAGP